MLIRDVELVHWNPRKYRIPKTHIRVGPRKNNFGDLLGPMITRRILEMQAIRKTSDCVEAGEVARSSGTNRRLLAVGSIMHMAREGDVVWGAGVNGKVAAGEHDYRRLDVRAVRGPLTAEWLLDNKRIDAPHIFGDPGLLVGHLWPDLRAFPKRRNFALIPNLNEAGRFQDHPSFVSPVAPLERVLHAIAESEYVVGSSLHAIIIADSLGVPSALLESSAEPAFKYEDYFRGTGRDRYAAFTDLSKAITHASSITKKSSYDPLGDWNRNALIAAFPMDMWSSRTVS